MPGNHFLRTVSIYTYLSDILDPLRLITLSIPRSRSSPYTSFLLQRSPELHWRESNCKSLQRPDIFNNSFQPRDLVWWSEDWISKTCPICLYPSISCEYKSAIRQSKTTHDIWRTFQQRYVVKTPEAKVRLESQLLDLRKTSKESLDEDIMKFAILLRHS